MREHSENALDLGVSYLGQKKGEERKKNKHYFGIFKYQALSVISYVIFCTLFWCRIDLDAQSTDEETEFQRSQVSSYQGNWEMVDIEFKCNHPLIFFQYSADLWVRDKMI